MSTPEKKDGGPAFPYAFEHDGHANISGFAPGMSLRDWFAGQALIMLPHHGCGADLDSTDTAIAAYQIADAMLAARTAPRT